MRVAHSSRHCGEPKLQRVQSGRSRSRPHSRKRRAYADQPQRKHRWGSRRFLSSTETDAHPTVVIGCGHDRALLRESAVVGVRHVEEEAAAGESPLGLSQFRGVYGADLESGGGEAFTGPGEGGPDEDGVSNPNHVGGAGF